MRFFNLLLSLLFTFCMLSCTSHSQSNFDLAEVRMPYEASNLINKQYEIKEGKSTFEHLKSYKSEDQKLLTFNKIKLKQQQTEKYFTPTSLNLFLDEKSNLIKCFDLKTSVREDSKNLYTSIIEKYGKPNYYNKDENFFNGIWELNDTYLILKQNFTSKIEEKETIKSKLIILQNDDQKLIDHYLYEGLNNYNDYLNTRIEKQDSNYSYLQFAEDKKNDFFGEEKYANELLNNLPL
ncbi:hypothetical protein [Aquimarina sp. RZ0]|uniref:hypothetical protein n=1 Tax=Aquimarina sp. RZ0 TaxID=2607730 RepID=UPI0011F1BBD6|nr:hypothetical protein [Aquimarina sp. RZ0]KAA1245319.1 hypothetical protein F0000_12420 [Aquimarina sp. RZ0]